MDNAEKQTYYLCNPDINTQCGKQHCIYNPNSISRVCYMTIGKKYARRDFDGKPVLPPLPDWANDESKYRVSYYTDAEGKKRPTYLWIGGVRVFTAETAFEQMQAGGSSTYRASTIAKVAITVAVLALAVAAIALLR